jgi:hypothetical protein
MRKAKTRFEQVPLTVVEKLLKSQRKQKKTASLVPETRGKKSPSR